MKLHIHSNDMFDMLCRSHCHVSIFSSIFDINNVKKIKSHMGQSIGRDVNNIISLSYSNNVPHGKGNK